MALALLEGQVTLAPYKRIYVSKRETAFLADDRFVTKIRRDEFTEVREPTPLQDATDLYLAQSYAHTLDAGIVYAPEQTKFEALVAQWLNDIAFDSFPEDMKDHDSFREIISGGNRAVPLIAASLRKRPSFLFLALEEILGCDPIREEVYGNLNSTVFAWLKWLQS